MSKNQDYNIEIITSFQQQKVKNLQQPYFSKAISKPSKKTDRKPKKSVEYLGTGPIFQVLIYQSANNIAGFLILTLYMIIDSVFIGQYLGEAGLASSSVGASLELLICIIIIQSLSVGVISIIGPALGQNKIEEARNYATQFFLLLIIYNIITPIVILPLKDIIARGLGATTEPTYSYLQGYMWIMYSIGVLSYTINGGLLPLLRQENKVKEAMICLIVSSLLNIILDAVLFIFFLDELKMECAAISTVVSQLVIDIWILFNFLGGIKATILKFDKKFIKFEWIFIKTTFKQFVPAAFNTIPAIVAQALTSNQIAKYAGERTTQYQAIWGIQMRLVQLLVQPRMGIYFGFLSIFSYNLGQNNNERISKLILYSDWLSTGILICIDAIMIGLMPYLIAMFYSDREFINVATPILRLSFSGMWAMGSLTFASGILQMKTKVIQATLIQVTRLVVNIITIFVIPIYLDIKWIFICPTITEISGFCVGQIVIIFQSYYYRKIGFDLEKDKEIIADESSTIRSNVSKHQEQ